MKYGIINLTANQQPYHFFDDIKKSYYERSGIPFKYVYNEPRDRMKGAHEMVYISDCTHPSGIPAMLEKFLWALREIEKSPEWNDCDYILRTNSSTFINLEVIEKYLRDLPRQRCYAGSVTFNKFISGTAILFSRDVASMLARKNPGNERKNFDDLVLAKYMRRSLIRMRDIPMMYYIDNAIHDVESIRRTLDEFPLVRIRNDSDRNTYDIDVWRKIAEIKGIAIPEKMKKTEDLSKSL